MEEKDELKDLKDLKQKGDEMARVPSVFRKTIFFGQQARALLLLSFKLTEMGSFSISA